MDEPSTVTDTMADVQPICKALTQILNSSTAVSSTGTSIIELSGTDLSVHIEPSGANVPPVDFRIPLGNVLNKPAAILAMLMNFLGTRIINGMSNWDSLNTGLKAFEHVANAVDGHLGRA